MLKTVDLRVWGFYIYNMYIVMLCMLLGPCPGQVIACTASFGDTAILQAKVTCMESSQVREQSHTPSASVSHNVERATRVGSGVKVKSPRVQGLRLRVKPSYPKMFEISSSKIPGLKGTGLRISTLQVVPIKAQLLQGIRGSPCWGTVQYP